MLILLTIISTLVGIYYYRILLAAFFSWVFWNYALTTHFKLDNTYFFEWFFGLFSIYLIGQCMRGIFGKYDVTLLRFLK